MGGRLALIVGSECAAFRELGFTNELATELYSNLTTLGGWRSALTGVGPVLNPTVAQLVSAVDEAFDTAAAQQATLLIGFVGHGTATSAEDFFLLCHDSPSVPNSQTALHLTQTIRERLNRSALDGLVVLVDACETEQGLLGAARRWTELLVQSTGRMELLVAAGDGPAFAGCFTRTMLATFQSGLPLRGENLLPSDLVDPIADHCKHQQPQHLSFTSGAASASYGGDPGLWLVPNAARRQDAVTGRPAAGFVDQLTRQLVLTDTVRERLAEIIESGGNRLRAVIGPAGCGKSTLLSMLVRPSLVDGLPIASEYITAAVFLTVNSSIDYLVSELAAQLRERLAGYSDAARACGDSVSGDGFEVEIRQPLLRLSKAGRRVTIAVDGLDQPEEGNRRLLVDGVAALTTGDELRHVRVIVGIREGTGVEDAPELHHMHRIELTEPPGEDIATLLTTAKSGHRSIDPRTESDVRKALTSEISATRYDELRPAAGGWLLARLLIESDAETIDRDITTEVDLDTVVGHRVRIALESANPETVGAMASLLAILVAAGAGPVLPLELLEVALSHMGEHPGRVRLRDLTVSLGVLVIRSQPGSAHESLGVLHSALLPALTTASDHLGVQVVSAHGAIAAAIGRITDRGRLREFGAVVPVDVGMIEAQRYAQSSAVRHYLASGNSASALALLRAEHAEPSAGNVDRLAAWVPSFVAAVGAEHPDTVALYNDLESWRAERDSADGAVESERSPVAREHGRGADSTPAMITSWGMSTERRRSRGGENRTRLQLRSDAAWNRANSGDLAGAIIDFERLLTDRVWTLGVDARETLQTRSDIAWCRAESNDLMGARDDYERLLLDQERIFAADSFATLLTRGEIAWCRREGGDPTGALVAYEGLLVDQERVLGADDPSTLQTRGHIAWCLSDRGDIAGARAGYERLRDDQERVLGADDPATLQTRSDMAWCRSEVGDLAGALSEYRRLLLDRERVLGPDDPATLHTRHDIAWCRAESHDFIGALDDFERVLADRQRVLGVDSPAALLTRSGIAWCRSEAGDLAGAIQEYRRLLADRERVLGTDNRATLQTRRDIAWCHAEGGNLTIAIAQFEQLLADHRRRSGINDPESLKIRYGIVWCREEGDDWARAHVELRELLADQAKILSPNHRDIFRTRSGIAFSLYQSGDVAKAHADYERLLVDQIRIFGPESSEVLTSRRNVAFCHADSGYFGGMLAVCEQLLGDCRRIVGLFDRTTLRTIANLAWFRAEQRKFSDRPSAGRDFADAAKVLARRVADRAQYPEPIHYGTLSLHGQLAWCQAECGDLGAAIARFEQLVSDREQHYGADHSTTLGTRHSLALCRAIAGNLMGASADLARLATHLSRVLGPDHPSTLLARRDMARCRAECGDAAAAIEELARLVADRTRLLGQDHPGTLSARGDLVECRAEHGDLRIAIAEASRLLSDQSRVLGSDNVATVRSREILDRLIREQ
ncbi:tetratricopeptide repeat protein [Nocardia suismassiliense]|uniref:Tetratricopeptide repeat protein n=1 Tax=Nocardia suismassiliense TaxID=2077092 RepID=A0ABW6QQC5_9NOCA